MDISAKLQEVEDGIASGKGRAWCASRGEYLCGLLMADYLGWEFLDAADGIVFDDEGRLDDDATQENFPPGWRTGNPLLSPVSTGRRRTAKSARSPAEAAILPVLWLPVP